MELLLGRHLGLPTAAEVEVAVSDAAAADDGVDADDAGYWC